MTFVIQSTQNDKLNIRLLAKIFLIDLFSWLIIWRFSTLMTQIKQIITDKNNKNLCFISLIRKICVLKSVAKQYFYKLNKSDVKNVVLSF